VQQMGRDRTDRTGGEHHSTWAPTVRLVVAVIAVAAAVSMVRGVQVAAAQDPVGDRDPIFERDPEPEIDGEALGPFIYGRDCAGCHGSDGEGSPRGVPLSHAGEALTHYSLVSGRMPIRDPRQIPERSPTQYDDDEIDALVEHVAALGDGPALPDVDWRSGDIPNGGRLYRLHCAACHSVTGIGGALAFERFAPSVMPSEPTVVAAAVVAGPGAMPSFSPQGFTDQDLADLVAYVQEIQEPVDRGGWAIFRAGRADEALFTWIVAIPALLLGLSWIARRAR
jgi:ubiquinol-cytochrome c reductase cytochrome c subunit